MFYQERCGTGKSARHLPWTDLSVICHIHDDASTQVSFYAAVSPELISRTTAYRQIRDPVTPLPCLYWTMLAWRRYNSTSLLCYSLDISDVEVIVNILKNWYKTLSEFSQFSLIREATPKPLCLQWKSRHLEPCSQSRALKRNSANSRPFHSFFLFLYISLLWSTVLAKLIYELLVILTIKGNNWSEASSISDTSYLGKC